MDLLDVYYSIESISEPQLVDYMTQLDDDEIDSEMSFEDTAEMFLEEFDLDVPHKLIGVIENISVVGKYIQNGDVISVDVGDIPSMIMKGYRDMFEQLDALDGTPDANHR